MKQAKHYFIYLIVRFLSLLFALIPFSILYSISNLLAFFLRTIFKYRRNTIIHNLNLVWPNISPQDKEKLVRKIYLNLSDVLLETVKGLSMSKRTMLKRFRLINPEFLDDYAMQNRSVIAVNGHINNWEWGITTGELQIKHKIYCVYKKIKNKFVDRYILNSRSKWNASMVAMYQTGLSFRNVQKHPCLFILMADQNPADGNKAIWIDFLGINTACIHGPAVYAKRFNLDLIYLKIVRIKRGYYEASFEAIVENPSLLTDQEITQQYMKKVEDQILETPENWLWTHKRWKRNQL